MALRSLVPCTKNQSFEPQKLKTRPGNMVAIRRYCPTPRLPQPRSVWETSLLSCMSLCKLLYNRKGEAF